MQDQSIPTQIRSDGITLVGIGMPTLGIDGRLSGGGATKLLTPVANGPVTGSSGDDLAGFARCSRNVTET